MRLGVDLVKVARIQGAVEKHGEAFLKRVFTNLEIEYCEAHRRRKFEHYAGRFAAKEALYKALTPQGGSLRYRDLELRNLPNGAPEFIVSSTERKRLGVPDQAAISVSLAHDTDYAVAVVLVS